MQGLYLGQAADEKKGPTPGRVGPSAHRGEPAARAAGLAASYSAMSLAAFSARGALAVALAFWVPVATGGVASCRTSAV